MSTVMMYCVLFVLFFVCSFVSSNIAYERGFGHVPDEIEPPAKRLKKGLRYILLAVFLDTKSGQILLLRELMSSGTSVLAIRVEEDANLEADIGGIYSLIEGELTRLKT